MTFIPTPNVVKCDMQFLVDGQQLHNTFYVLGSGSWTQEEREELNEAVVTWWTAATKTFMNSACALTQVTTTNQESAEAPSSIRIVAPPIAGTGATTRLPANAAICATIRTNLRGRSYRGRMYLGGLDSNTHVSSVSIATTFITQVVTLLTALNAAITALGKAWVIVSHFHNKAARVSGLCTTVNAIAVDSYFDSQRRRLGGRGV